MSKRERDRRRLALWLRDGGICLLCDEPIPREEILDDEYNLDHIRPRSHGGSNQNFNLRLVHLACNSEKANSCDGCEVCAKDRKQEFWRRQYFRCARCEVVILPSEVFDNGKVDVSVSYAKGPKRENGVYYLLHLSCISDNQGYRVARGIV